jgi:adenylate cyclase
MRYASTSIQGSIGFDLTDDGRGREWKATAETAEPGVGTEQHPIPPADWLLREGRFAATTRDLLDRLCRRLTAAGLPLWRVTYHQRTLHPRIGTTTYCWRRDQEEGASVIHRPHGCQETPQYLNSPVAAVVDGAETVRRRLEGGAAEPGFPVLDGLRAEGATDYAAMPVAFSDGLVTVVTWASDRPGGFTAAELRRLDDLLPALGAVLEARAVRRIATTVLDTYVGHAAGERILRGEIRRGDGAAFHAPLWYCDMRGFTMLSETLPRDELLALLDEYFERVIAPVAAHGGEVLKFIGDSVLAAFPAAEGVSRRAACRSALAAAGGALAGMAGLNRERAAAGKPALGVGLALHVGEVVSGNVGTPERLDFTVIGPAVNLTYRLEKLCRPLGRTLLLSRDFARGCGRPLLSLGHHRLHGVAEPQEVFALPPVGTAENLRTTPTSRKEPPQHRGGGALMNLSGSHSPPLAASSYAAGRRTL